MTELETVIKRTTQLAVAGRRVAQAGPPSPHIHCPCRSPSKKIDYSFISLVDTDAAYSAQTHAAGVLVVIGALPHAIP